MSKHAPHLHARMHARKPLAPLPLPLSILNACAGCWDHTLINPTPPQTNEQPPLKGLIVAWGSLQSPKSPQVHVALVGAFALCRYGYDSKEGSAMYEHSRSCIVCYG